MCLELQIQYSIACQNFPWAFLAISGVFWRGSEAALRVRYALAVTLRRSMRDGAGSDKVIEHLVLDEVEKSAISHN